MVLHIDLIKKIVVAVVVVLFGYLIWYTVAYFGTIESHVRFPAQTTLRIGFVGDWEFGTRKRLKNKLPIQATVELKKAVDFLNHEFLPDLAVGGGDYIESSAVKPEDAKAQLREVNDIFKQVQAPRVYALGNHDLRSLTKEEVREILEIAENHAVSDIGGWRVVVLDTNFNKEDDSHRGAKNYTVGYVGKDELAWLENALQTDQPVIVFAHHSPVVAPEADGSIGPPNILNAEAVRVVLERNHNVVAVISGHTPTSYHEKRNGIHYVIVDTLVNESALGSFATLEFRSHSQEQWIDIDVVQYGNSPQRYQLGWSGTRER